MIFFFGFLENVEEMPSPRTTSPMSDDASFMSTATVKEQVITASPSLTASSISPKKQTPSPKVRISKSPVSEFSTEHKSREHGQSPTSTSETGLKSVADKTENKTSEPVNIDLTDNEMEVEQSAVVSQSEVKGGEIFKEFEELNPPGEIEEGEIGEIEEMEVVTSDNEAVSSSTSIRTVVKHEVEEEVTEFVAPPSPVRQLRPPQQPPTPEVRQELYMF